MSGQIGGQQPYGILAEYDSGVSDKQRRSQTLPEYSDEERKLLTRVENRANNELLFGLKYHVMRRSFLDLAYYNGFQHIYWSFKQHRLRQVPSATGRSRITDNKIMPAVQHAVKILTSNIDFSTLSGSIP